MAAISEQQYTALACIAFTASILSICGSSSIVYIASSRVDQLYHRLMIGLSICDIIVSGGLILQPILIPEDLVSIYGFGQGNNASCSALGFLMRFPLAVAVYNCYLSLYFNYSLRYGWQQTKCTCWEIIAHTAAFIIPTTFGIVGVLTESFNFLPELYICEYSGVPAGCERKEDVPCIRGELSRKEDWVYVSVMLTLTALSIWATASIYLFFRAQYSTNEDHQRVRQVAVQTVLYLIAFLNGTFWSAVTRVAVDSGISDRSSYVLSILSYLFFPLQGFWNAYIYIRPRWMLWQRAYPKAPYFHILRKTFSREEPFPRRRLASIRRIGIPRQPGMSESDSRIRINLGSENIEMNHSELTESKQSNDLPTASQSTSKVVQESEVKTREGSASLHDMIEMLSSMSSSSVLVANENRAQKDRSPRRIPAKRVSWLAQSCGNMASNTTDDEGADASARTNTSWYHSPMVHSTLRDSSVMVVDSSTDDSQNFKTNHLEDENQSSNEVEALDGQELKQQSKGGDGDAEV